MAYRFRSMALRVLNDTIGNGIGVKRRKSCFAIYKHVILDGFIMISLVNGDIVERSWFWVQEIIDSEPC